MTAEGWERLAAVGSQAAAQDAARVGCRGAAAMAASAMEGERGYAQGVRLHRRRGGRGCRCARRRRGWACCGQRRSDEVGRAGLAELRPWRATPRRHGKKARRRVVEREKGGERAHLGNVVRWRGTASGARLRRRRWRGGERGRDEGRRRWARNCAKIPGGSVLEASWVRKLRRAVLGKMYSGELPDARARQSSGGGGRARRSTRGRAVVHAGAPQMGRDGRWAGDAAGVHVGPGARPRDGRGAGSRELAHSRAGSWAASRRPKTGGGSARPSGGGRGGEGAGPDRMG
jgi:hypothetical protein